MRITTVYPEGRDPLIVGWQAGKREAHPNWTDAEFWAQVAHEIEIEKRAHAVAAAKQKTKKETPS